MTFVQGIVLHIQHKLSSFLQVLKSITSSALTRLVVSSICGSKLPDALKFLAWEMHLTLKQSQINLQSDMYINLKDIMDHYIQTSGPSTT